MRTRIPTQICESAAPSIWYQGTGIPAIRSYSPLPSYFVSIHGATVALNPFLAPYPNNLLYSITLYNPRCCKRPHLDVISNQPQHLSPDLHKHDPPPTSPTLYTTKALAVLSCMSHRDPTSTSDLFGFRGLLCGIKGECYRISGEAMGL